MGSRRWCPRCGRRGNTTKVLRRFETRGGVAMVLRSWSHLTQGADPKDCEEVRTADLDASVGPWGRST